MFREDSWLPKGFEFLSGFPERLRRGRIVVTFQSFFDDSGSKGTGKYMAMSGIAGDAGKVAAMTDEWDRALWTAYPAGKIRYFKMSEALNLKGEFADWREEARDAKIRQMAEVINRDDLVGISSAIDLRAHNIEWERLGYPHRKNPLNQPYLLCVYHAIVASIAEAYSLGARKPIEIVFDNHDVFRPVVTAEWPKLRELVPEPHRSICPYYAMFRDDTEFLALQAADLLAGSLRIAGEFVAGDDDPGGHEWVGNLCPRLRLSKYSQFYSTEKLREIGDGWRQFGDA